MNSDLQGRIVTIKLLLFELQYQIVNIYAPAGTDKRVQNEIFFDNLYPHTDGTLPVVIGGDFNCIENPNLDKYPPTLAYPKPDTLFDLKSNLNLIDTFRSFNPTATTYTRHAHNSHSRLDRFYTNHLCHPSTHTILPTPFSDHDLVILTLTPHRRHTYIKGKKLYWKNNSNNYTIPEYNYEINEMIDRLARNLNDTECNPLQNWQSFKNHLKKCLIKQSGLESKKRVQENLAEQQRLAQLRENMTHNPTATSFQVYKACQR